MRNFCARGTPKERSRLHRTIKAGCSDLRLIAIGRRSFVCCQISDSTLTLKHAWMTSMRSNSRGGCPCINARGAASTRWRRRYSSAGRIRTGKCTRAARRLSEAYGQRDEKMIALLKRYGGAKLPDDGFGQEPSRSNSWARRRAAAIRRSCEWGWTVIRGGKLLRAPLEFWNHWIGPWSHHEWDRGAGASLPGKGQDAVAAMLLTCRDRRIGRNG